MNYEQQFNMWQENVAARFPRVLLYSDLNSTLKQLPYSKSLLSLCFGYLCPRVYPCGLRLGSSQCVTQWSLGSPNSAQIIKVPSIHCDSAVLAGQQDARNVIFSNLPFLPEAFIFFSYQLLLTFTFSLINFYIITGFESRKGSLPAMFSCSIYSLTFYIEFPFLY